MLWDLIVSTLFPQHAIKSLQPDEINRVVESLTTQTNAELSFKNCLKIVNNDFENQETQELLHQEQLTPTFEDEEAFTTQTQNTKHHLILSEFDLQQQQEDKLEEGEEIIEVMIDENSFNFTPSGDAKEESLKTNQIPIMTPLDFEASTDSCYHSSRNTNESLSGFATQVHRSTLTISSSLNNGQVASPMTAQKFSSYLSKSCTASSTPQNSLFSSTALVTQFTIAEDTIQSTNEDSPEKQQNLGDSVENFKSEIVRSNTQTRVKLNSNPDSNTHQNVNLASGKLEKSSHLRGSEINSHQNSDSTNISKSLMYNDGLSFDLNASAVQAIQTERISVPKKEVEEIFLSIIFDGWGAKSGLSLGIEFAEKYIKQKDNTIWQKEKIVTSLIKEKLTESIDTLISRILVDAFHTDEDEQNSYDFSGLKQLVFNAAIVSSIGYVYGLQMPDNLFRLLCLVCLADSKTTSSVFSRFGFVSSKGDFSKMRFKEFSKLIPRTADSALLQAMSREIISKYKQSSQSNMKKFLFFKQKNGVNQLKDATKQAKLVFDSFLTFKESDSD